MDPEIEARVLAETEKILAALLWQMRETSGEFPVRIRVDLFFSRGEGTRRHFVEVERIYGSDFIAEAEEAFQKIKKKQLVDEAASILRGTKT